MKEITPLLRDAFEYSNEGACLVSAEGVFLMVNRQLCRYLGYSAEELVGRPFSAFTHPDDMYIGADQVRAMLAGDRDNAKFEKRYLTKSGQPMHALVSSNLKRDDDGRPQYFITHILDLTDRIRAEEQFTHMFSSMLDGYALHEIIVDGNGEPVDYRFLRVNPSFEKMTGLSARDVVGKTILELLPGTEKLWIERYGKVALTGKPTTFEAYSREVGRHFMVSAHSPAPGQFACSFTDITDRLAIEAELRTAMETAEDASRTKTEFLANMSHEIRTPLNGVLGMLQLVQTTPLNDEQREYVAIGIRSAHSLLRILADILDLSRIEAGKLEIVDEEFALDEVVTPVLEAFVGEMTDRDVDLRWKPDPRLSERFVGDPVRLRQILYNLVGNAVKFTPEGSVGLEVYPLPVMAPDGRQHVHFVVEDTGIGIADEALERIFESFTQADSSTTRKYGGTGLGLGMVKRLVGLMGGTTQVVSEPGRGTQMHFTIPLRPVRHPAEAEAAGPAASLTGRIRVLLVEDDPVNSYAAALLLRKHGMEVETADNGAEALNRLAEKTFDFVLMDVQMPVMSGLEATRRIRTDPAFERVRDIPVIALTAHAMSGDRERFLEAGMSGYLPKPVDIDDLLDAIRTMLG
jgi:PAS domain S-box-containing protein